MYLRLGAMWIGQAGIGTVLYGKVGLAEVRSGSVLE